MRNIQILLLVLVTTHTSYGQCSAGVCIPWRDSGKPVCRISLHIQTTRICPTAQVTLLSLENGKEWSRQFSQTTLREIHTIVVPRGKYFFSVTAVHNKPFNTFVDAAESNVSLSTLKLAPANVIEGFVESNGGPVGNALIECGSRRIRTDAKGHYAFEFTNDDWPSHLIASHPGFAKHPVSLPEFPGDYVCPPIHLQDHPGTARVHVNFPLSKTPLVVLLGVRGKPHPLWLIQRRLVNARDIVFSGLEAGQYVIGVSGTEPLQRAAATIDVGPDEEHSVTVDLHESILRGRVLLGSAPLGAATLRFSHQELSWSRALVTDANGRFRSRIWSRGTYNVSIKGGGIRTPQGRRVTMPAASREELLIRLPARTIRGHVFDKSGHVVSSATIFLRSDYADIGQVRHDITGNDGAFEFDAVSGERHTLSVEAPHFLRAEPESFTMPESTSFKDMEVVLDAGFQTTFRVIDSSGAPVAGAAVMSASPTRVRALELSDSAGRVILPLDRNTENTVYIFSAEGSISVRRSRELLGGARSVVIVPDATASILVHTQKSDGTPFESVSLLLRHEGNLIPAFVIDELHLRHTLVLTSNSAGEIRIPHAPTGAYEFWPYATDEEATDIASSIGSEPAPVSLTATAGPNEVTIRFEQRNAVRSPK